MHARDHDVDLREQFLGTVERAVVEDVDLDAGEDAERRHLLVQAGDDVDLLAEPVGGESVRDRQARRMVGEREVLVPERPGALRHHLDRVAAVGPVGVDVQVALQLRTQRVARFGAGRLRVLEQLLQVLGRLPRQRFRDHGRGGVADAREILQPVVVGEELQLRVGNARRSRARPA